VEEIGVTPSLLNPQGETFFIPEVTRLMNPEAV
jgi:hypothetical protein